jgi:hypothetical protein
MLFWRHVDVTFCVMQRMVKQRNLPFSFKPEQGSRVGLLAVALSRLTLTHCCSACCKTAGTHLLHFSMRWTHHTDQLACLLCVLQCMVKQRNLPFSFKAEQGSRVGLLSAILS